MVIMLVGACAWVAVSALASEATRGTGYGSVAASVIAAALAFVAGIRYGEGLRGKRSRVPWFRAPSWDRRKAA